MFFARIAVAVAAASTVLGSVLPRTLPTGTVTCGSNKYSPIELSAAIIAGNAFLNDDNLQGMAVSESLAELAI